ncbi:actin binding Rho activating protein b [Centropristis striata]|uniref:actin binding Rho activating protein b n=1 Tax=Centropristis striata TaxID=184440 RepID=UPI0027DF781E|nr:actin binding Rho activating protein b [Centropristis striata]
MSDKQTSQRKPSTNKNIKKLRAISMVCSLASSWQHWVTDNEEKQASEPSGWAPTSLGEPEEKPRKTWVPKKPPPAPIQPTEAPQNDVISLGEAEKTSTPHNETKDAAKTEEVKTSAEPPSRIKVKQVVKTVTSGVQEKGAGVGLLTEKIKKESLPSDEEIDRLLKKKSSPTRRRKCSNMVSSLTKSWKKVENDQKLKKEGVGPGEGHTCGGGDKHDSGHNEAEKERVGIEDVQTQRISSLKEEEQNDSEEGPAIRIKRPSVPIFKKEAEDANKINALSKKYSAVGNLKSRWQNWASEHTDNQKLNPFSEYFDYDYSMSLRLQKGEDGYGRPKEGTKTAERAKRAEQHIHREIADMCYVIRTMADPGPDGKTRITFGELFERYVRISDKVVGILMRARKHGKVAFEGEMLWQGQDDGVIITLLV